MTTRLLTALFLVVAPTLAGGAPMHVCSYPASIAGGVIVGSLTGPSVSLRWTILETPEIEAYQLIRVPAAAAAASSPTSSSPWPRPTVTIAELEPDSEHLWTERTYQISDPPPAGTWVYRLIVRKHDGMCMLETVALTIPERPSCGIVDVCNQVRESIAGGVIGDSARAPFIRLEWGSCAEDGSVRGYRIKRRLVSCSGADCWRSRGFIRADGTCGEIKMHSITEEPRAGDYIYRVEVLDNSSRTVCTVETLATRVP